MLGGPSHCAGARGGTLCRAADRVCRQGWASLLGQRVQGVPAALVRLHAEQQHLFGTQSVCHRVAEAFRSEKILKIISCRY